MTATVRPNMMIGITHTPDGGKIIKESKALKVGLGYPRGKACDVYVNTDGKWVIRVGKNAGGKMEFKSLKPLDTRVEAEAAFREAWKSADICGYPRKVAHFQFTRPVLGADGGEMYIPDFNAIEAYSFADPKHPGPPTEIDIVFLDDSPFTGGYQMWSASELRCFGDGENALRVLSLATTPEEKELAKQAAAEGKKHFPVIGGCWTCNCVYKNEGTDGRGRPTPAPCKPGADIKFQLSRNIRVGVTAFFHTSSFKSIVQIFSSIERIKELTGGRIAMIPLKLVIRSHKTNHNGQAAVHQNVSIEFRAEDMESVRKNLIEQAWKVRSAIGMAEPVRAITAPAEESPDLETLEDTSPLTPQSMAGEFYRDEEEQQDQTPEEPWGGEPDTPAVAEKTIPAAVATQAKQDTLAEKLRLDREAKEREAETRFSEPPPGTVIVFPWSERAGMLSLYNKQLERLGKPAFDTIVLRHKTMMGTLRHDDPLADTIYKELLAARVPETRPLF